MATRPDELCAADGQEPYDNALTRAQARLTETLTELSRLTQDPLFYRVDGVIAISSMPRRAPISMWILSTSCGT